MKKAPSALVVLLLKRQKPNALLSCVPASEHP